jgi:hypothetical protein
MPTFVPSKYSHLPTTRDNSSLVHRRQRALQNEGEAAAADPNDSYYTRFKTGAYYLWARATGSSAGEATVYAAESATGTTVAPEQRQGMVAALDAQASGGQLKDAQGATYNMAPGGQLELTSDTYKASGVEAGSTFAVNSDKWKGMVKNLATGSGANNSANRQILDAILGKSKVDEIAGSAPSAPPPATSGPVAPPFVPTDKPSITKKPWFFPVVIGSSVLLIGGITYAATRKKDN